MSRPGALEQLVADPVATIRDWVGPDGVAVVICGGLGTRLAPLTNDLPKALVPVAGKALILHVLEYWSPHVAHFVFVVNHFGDRIASVLEASAVSFEIVEESGPPRGIAQALLQSRHLVGARFITLLGDCVCGGQFLVLPEAELALGVERRADPLAVSKSYSVELAAGHISRVVEKPQVIPNDLCGTGFYFLTPRIFDAILETPADPRTNQVELTSAIQTIIDGPSRVSPFFLDGWWINVTVAGDVERAGALLQF
jgi:glucose-1-phosphate thymidylyltransferase